MRLILIRRHNRMNVPLRRVGPVPLLLIVMSGLALVQSKALLTVLEKYRERTGAPE
jgi:hypothetical protein